jgi:hypothetical protein
MATYSPEKEARGRKAAESAEKNNTEDLEKTRQYHKKRFEDAIKNRKPLIRDKDGNIVKPPEKKI